MFTGIIEKQGTIHQIIEKGGNRSFWISSPLSSKLKVDQSVSHDGVCLTVEEVKNKKHRVTAIAETLSKTTLGQWEKGRVVNIERCLKMNGRLDGHFVQGHVDGTGTCILREEQNGSWRFRFRFDPRFAPLVIEKGSITINGISLTAFAITRDELEVAIIPFTYEHTNIQYVQVGDSVNLEFDLIGKYLLRKAACE